MVSGISTNSLCDDQSRFDSLQDEALHWKQVAEDYLQKLTHLREEFDDYQEGSRELEAELETQIEQYEQRVADLLNNKYKLEEENGIIRERIEVKEKQTYLQISQLEDENLHMKTEREELTKYIRELEQSNDDLERSKRTTLCSLEEFDARLNNAIERNVFLENELEEKEQLMVSVQRLKDESRDLKNELALSSKGISHPSLNGTRSPLIDSGRTSVLSSRPSSKNSNSSSKTVKKKKSSESFNHCNGSTNIFCSKIPLSKSKPARISALNIVSELIKKVGDLESKLASCKNASREQTRNGRFQRTGNNINSQTEKTALVKGIVALNSRKKSWN